MADPNIQKQKRSLRRRRRVRGIVIGSGARPRLTVAKSNKNIFVQIVDDEKAATLASMASNASEFLKRKVSGTKTEIAREVGKAVAEIAKEKGITEVVFDRNVNRYHGRVKAVAEGARESGLKI